MNDTEPQHTALFNMNEWLDIVNAAEERGIDPYELVRRAVMDDVAR